MDIGKINSFPHEEINNANWRYLLIEGNRLFVECTESAVHEIAKITLPNSFFTKQKKETIRTGRATEKSIPYYNKYSCGSAQIKLMDFYLHILSKVESIVAGEVALCGQSLYDLVILCANYLIPGSRIEISL